MMLLLLPYCRFGVLDVVQNGSSIRPWWIHHHYLSALIAIAMLTWPTTQNYDEFMQLFNVSPYEAPFDCSLVIVGSSRQLAPPTHE